MKNQSSKLWVTVIILLIITAISCTNNKNENNNTSDTTFGLSQSGQEQQVLSTRGRRHKRRPGRGFQNRKQIRELKVSQKGENQAAGNALALTKSEEKAIQLETAIVTSKVMTTDLSAMGKVLENQYRKAIVSYPFPARIAQIDSRIGDYVKKGQKLLVLQSEEVGEATSAFYKTEADFELARVSLEREKKLFEKGVGAKKNLLSAEANLKIAAANMNAAEKKLHVLGFTEKEVNQIRESHQVNPVINLYAPIDGRVVKSDMVLGLMVDETTEILTIMDLSLLWVDAEIYEKDIAKIKIGQEVAIKVPAYQGEVFSGKVSYISDILNDNTHTLTVRTDVHNTGLKLKPGMFANLTVSLNHNQNALAVPGSAVLDDKGKKLVFVKTEGKYYPHEVQTGQANGSYIAIINGLEEGDEVVTKGNFQLKSKLYDEILKSAGVH